MKKDVKITKKKIIIISLIVLILLSILLCLYFFLPKSELYRFLHKEYYVPDYNENIFLNKAYMSFERDLLYGDARVQKLFNYEKHYEDAEDDCQFFLDYFDTVIRGKYDQISKFYVDGYFKESPKFTMQMIYEPSVIYHSYTTTEIDGEERTLYNFHVEYKIFKNNETFRPKLPSNTSIPQIYQLIKNKDGTYKIYKILDVKYE